MIICLKDYCEENKKVKVKKVIIRILSNWKESYFRNKKNMVLLRNKQSGDKK